MVNGNQLTKSAYPTNTLYGIEKDIELRGRFPYFCYQYLLLGQSWKLRNADRETTEELISYAQDNDLKKTAYNELRRRDLDTRELPNSVIVNEIITACILTKKLIRYAKNTYRMLKDT